MDDWHARAQQDAENHVLSYFSTSEASDLSFACAGGWVCAAVFELCFANMDKWVLHFCCQLIAFF